VPILNFVSYLEKHQPLVYKILSNAFSNGRLSHAYLLSGEPGAPLSETALFIAQSILCDNPSPWADLTCKCCRAAKEGTYDGLISLGGDGAPIKKGEVETIITRFSLTPLNGKRLVYIINNVETMTPEAVNSLLKFLEEPPDYVTAILTTGNLAKVLPTIISRCECLRLLLAPRKEIAEEAIGLGVSISDAEVLSHLYSNAESLRDASLSDEYKTAKKCVETFLIAIPLGDNSMYLAIARDILPALGDGVSAEAKKNGRLFLDLLSIAFKDAIAMREKVPNLAVEYAKLIEPLTHLASLETCLLAILRARALLDLNIPTGMIYDHLARILNQETSL